MEVDMDVDLGLCCVCGERKADTVIMLPYKSPSPGKGWGCFQCGLPNDGAVAVVCGECFTGVGQKMPDIKYMVIGYPAENVRIPYEPDKLEPFDHDEKKH